MPEQPPPDQPVKVEPESGDAVSVITLPLLNAAEQFGPQFMPEGMLVTVPLPVWVLVTVESDLKWRQVSYLCDKGITRTS